jgi:hypothetical protein
MDADMPIEYMICGLADLLRDGELDLIPVEMLVILNSALEREITMIRTVH